MRRCTLPVILLVSLALVAAGCGDDEGDTAVEETTTEEAVPQEEFVAQATEICARVNEELSQIQSFPEEGPPIIEQGLSDLEALPAPEGDEETFDQFIQEGQDALGQLQNAEQPPQQDPFDQFTQLGEQLGIEGGCTRTGG